MLREDADFRLLLGAQATSLLGDQMVTVALAFAVLGIGGDASDVGLVFAARSVALLLFVLGGGVLGDRLPRRAVLIITDLVRLASQGALAAVLIGGGRSIATIAALSAVTGAAGGVFNPTASGFLPEVVGPGRLQRANALRSLVSSGGRIAGPLLAGLLVATVGAGWAIAVDAATYAVSAALLAGIRVRPRIAVATAHGGARRRAVLLAELREGWTAFRSYTWLFAIVVWAAVDNVTIGAWRVLGPVVAHDHLGGVGAWSAIVAASGAGGVVGGLLALRAAPSRPVRFLVLVFLVFYVPMALMAAGAPTGIIALGAAAGEVGMVLSLTVWESTVQRHVDPRLLSRVTSYDWLGSLAFEPVGLVLWGPVAALIGTREALGLAAVAGVLGVAAVLSVREVRTLPAAPAPALSGAPAR